MLKHVLNLGGSSNFSLAWDDGSQQQKPQPQKQGAVPSQAPFATEESKKDLVTSVKVHHAPGGGSSIVFGDEDTQKDTRFEKPATVGAVGQQVAAG